MCHEVAAALHNRRHINGVMQCAACRLLAPRMERRVDTEKKAKTPADFELVLGQGIHPFYLGMEADQVFEAAVGWRILFSERDSGGIQVHFEQRGKIIEVSLINTVWLYPGHYGDYRTYYVWTEDARFSDGKRLSRMKKENILSRFTGEHTLALEDYLSDGDDMYCSSYQNEEILLLFNEGIKPSLSISRMPKLRWEYD